MTEITLNDKIQEKTAVALGLFDGIHEGHKLIMRKVRSHTVWGNTIPAVFTFRTESVKFKHGKPLEYIYTNEQKLHFLESDGIKYVLSPDFDKVQNMSGEEFAEKILKGIMNTDIVVCGENFRFGRDASCGIGELKSFGKKYGFHVSVASLGEDCFSSEKFRDILRNGKISSLSNTEYVLYGKVVHGNQIGRTINFPTVNQLYAQGQLVPRFGVYSTVTLAEGKKYRSITNVGVKPTVEGERLPLAETHLLDFSGDLYGKDIEVKFGEFIRPERKFSSLDALRTQISEDIEKSKIYNGFDKL